MKKFKTSLTTRISDNNILKHQKNQKEEEFQFRQLLNHHQFLPDHSN